jgi:uncharacterized protein (UPF0147 family)
MDLKILAEIPPWEWPKGVDKTLLATLNDDRADADDRLLAAELASNIPVINDVLIEALLAVLQNTAESEDLRGTAAIALGPALEYADTGGFDDMDEAMVSGPAIDNIQKTLHRLYSDAALPKNVRRRVLEAAIRSPQDWHGDAIRAAWTCKDEDWRLTAVFAMRWVRGFDKQIIEALNSADPEILCEAVLAAGNWGLDEAWPQLSKILKANEVDKELMLTAIEAAVSIRPREAEELLEDLTHADDEDVADAAYEALAMIDGLAEDDEDDYDDEDEDY